MQFEMCALPGGGKLELYLRSPDPAMPNALRRPLVLVVPAVGTNTSVPVRPTRWRCSLQRQGITPPC